MTPVGEPLTPEHCVDNLQSIRKICKSLAAIHGAGYVHGDARIQNIILVRKEYLWVDFTGTPMETTATRIADVTTL
eukprot:1587871-Amphidinium_carterae.1